MKNGKPFDQRIEERVESYGFELFRYEESARDGQIWTWVRVQDKPIRRTTAKLVGNLCYHSDVDRYSWQVRQWLVHESVGWAGYAQVIDTNDEGLSRIGAAVDSVLKNWDANLSRYHRSDDVILMTKGPSLSDVAQAFAYELDALARRYEVLIRNPILIQERGGDDD